MTADDIDNLNEFPLFKLRAAERLGNGFKKIAVTTKQKDFERRITEVFKETSALKITDLDINGHDIMRVFKLKPSPLIKQIQEHLLKRVMDNQKLNRKVELVKLTAAYLFKINNGKK